MLWLYAVVPGDCPPPPAAQVSISLSRLAAEGVAVLYAEHDEEPGRSTDDVLAFGAVVNQVATHADPMLPARYGSAVATLEELRALVLDRAEAWRDRLAAVAGRAEMLVHVVDEEAPTKVPAAPGGSGREYLLSRARAVRFEESVYDDLATAVAEHADRVLRLSAEQAVRAACLVPKGKVEAFRAAIGGWAAGHPTRKVRVTGPWPPFSFAQEGE